MVTVVSVILTYVCILLGVAFFTLLERKGLSYIQTRNGPNNVGLIGLLQPLADALNLFVNENISPYGSNLFAFYLAPALGLILALLLWHVYPSSTPTKYINLGVLFFMCISAINVYSILIAGWSSNSNYAFLGALRAAAQTISYEVSIILILLFPIFIVGSISFDAFSSFQFWLFLLLTPVFFMWVCSAVAETNRAPFDFAEGESEIVSGFNIEYGAAGFALLFMAEYANILLMSIVTAVLFLGSSHIVASSTSATFFTLNVLIIAFFFIWVRSAYPRFRYDLLMALTWNSFLPFILGALGLIVVALLADS